MPSAFVYLMASRPRGATYCGSTGDLARRVYEHREALAAGHTRKYNCHRLVWYEVHDGILNAREREARIKKWKREWKIELIEATNLEWRDLYSNICR